MTMLTKKISDMFSSSEGSVIFDRINRYINENNMHECFPEGVLLGFSGGPDSVMLLSFLYEYRQRNGNFPIAACHINHMIRAEAADADEAMAGEFAGKLGVEFISKKIDIPTLARERSLGTEECARDARYLAFAEIIQSRKDLNYISTAHNLGDNVETVIFNILRGAGPLGACGISPRRGNIIRPMLSVSKSDILSLLDKFEIPYSIDKTNLSSDYTRNFIRNQVLPKVSERFPSYEVAISRFAENMHDCYDFISSEARSFLSQRGKIKNIELGSLSNAVFAEVLSIISGDRQSRELTVKIKELLKNANFSYNLPANKIVLCERGVCSVSSADAQEKEYRYALQYGLNRFSEFSSLIYISEEPLPKTYSNIYKISIQDRIPSDIIYGELYIRPKKAGDTIYYNGMTHKIKKMFCDRKIPNSKKSLIPIFCDDNGPLFVPGYHVRGDVKAAEKYVYVYILDDTSDVGNRFFTGRDFSE